MPDEFQTIIPAPENNQELNNDIDALTDKAKLETENPPIAEDSASEHQQKFPEQYSKSALNEPTSDQINQAAAKAAIDASGTFHLTTIYKSKVNSTHAKIANVVAEIMSEAKRLENWTHEETIAIWHRVESELNIKE